MFLFKRETFMLFIISFVMASVFWQWYGAI